MNLTLIDIVVALVGSFFAVYSGAVMLNAPRHLLVPASLIGMVSWLLYVMLQGHVGTTLGTFIASLLVAFCSHLFSRRFKAPVTMFFIPAYLPFVPGISLYNSVFYFVNNNHAASTAYLIQTLQIAFAIALAIFTVDAAFSAINRFYKPQP